jgi:hypothetical protein
LKTRTLRRNIRQNFNCRHPPAGTEASRQRERSLSNENFIASAPGKYYVAGGNGPFGDASRSPQGIRNGFADAGRTSDRGMDYPLNDRDSRTRTAEWFDDEFL